MSYCKIRKLFNFSNSRSPLILKKSGGIRVLVFPLTWHFYIKRPFTLKNIQESMRLFFFNAFDIRKGELQRALLMQFNIFLIISTLLIVKPTVNALFLAKYGVEQLPFAYIMVALVAALVSLLYSRWLSRSTLFRINISTLAFSIGCLLCFGFLLRFNLFENIILYLFYIWVAIFALLTTSQFWVLANMVFNPREAKRLFGFIGAGAIAGGIFGGYLTSILAERIGSENLPFVCAGILSVCIPVTRFIWKNNVVEVTPSFERKRSIPKNSQRPFQLIRQSKHLTYVACIVGVSVMVAKLVDYLFGGIAAKLIPDADELTAFFGFWFSTFNVISLLLQLFLTRKIVGTFGVGTSLFFLPGMILIAAVLLLFFPTLLIAAVFLKMADGSLKQSINKASMELIIMPISKEIKNQSKTFIDVFVDSLATGGIGIILIFVIKGLDLPMTAVSWMIIALLFLWIYFADKVRKEYLRSFQLKLREVVPKAKTEKLIDISNESVLNGMRRVLESGEDSQILFVLTKLREAPDDRLFESISDLLAHPSDEIKAEAIQNLYFFKKHNLSKRIKKLIHHPAQKIKIAAFEYLLLKDLDDEVELMKQYISDPDYRVSGAALVSLAKETRQNPEIRKSLDLEAIVDSKIKSLEGMQNAEEQRFLKISLLKGIGYANFSSYYHLIKQCFSDAKEEVVQQAITAAGNTLSTFFINDLLEFLTIKNTRSFAENALAHYDLGIIPILKYKVRQPEMTLEKLRKIPAVIKKIGRQASVDFLLELLDNEDGMVRLESLRGLNMLRNNFPHLDFNPKGIAKKVLEEAFSYQNTLSVLHAQSQLEAEEKRETSQEIVDARKTLVNLLDKKLQKTLERIFRLLGLKYPPHDIFQIYRGLNSEQPELGMNALEFLDNLLEPNIKKVLIPIVEMSMLESISEEAIKNLNLKIPEEEDCFKTLLQGKDIRIKIAVLYLMAKLKDRKYLPMAKELTSHPNTKISDHAQITVEALEKVQ